MLAYADTGVRDGNPAYQAAGIRCDASHRNGMAGNGSGAAAVDAGDWIGQWRIVRGVPPILIFLSEGVE